MDAINEAFARINMEIAQAEAAYQLKRQRLEGDHEALVEAADEFRQSMAPLRAHREEMLKRLADIKTLEPMAPSIVVPT